MTALTTSERDSLARMLGERKKLLREEIRRGLARMGNERYADLLSGTSDAGDESVAMLLTDVANAEVARDAAELRDIVAAEARIAAGTYGTCIDCGAADPFCAPRGVSDREALSPLPADSRGDPRTCLTCACCALRSVRKPGVQRGWAASNVWRGGIRPRAPAGGV